MVETNFYRMTIGVRRVSVAMKWYKMMGMEEQVLGKVLSCKTDEKQNFEMVWTSPMNGLRQTAPDGIGE